MCPVGFGMYNIVFPLIKKGKRIYVPLVQWIYN
jgi:hypothetical protein